jgi:hypothetical protein
MLPYLLPLPTPLIPLPFNSNGRGTHRFVPTFVYNEFLAPGLSKHDKSGSFPQPFPHYRTSIPCSCFYVVHCFQALAIFVTFRPISIWHCIVSQKLVIVTIIIRVVLAFVSYYVCKPLYYLTSSYHF